MTIHTSLNSSFTDPACENGDTFERCNLSQLEPDTAICAGKAGLTFTRCNLTNCDAPGDAIIDHCNTLQTSRCAHLHPTWPLAAEPDNCPHVIGIDEIVVDGTVVDTIYHREDTQQ